jgi:hypothetical protein
MGTQKQFHWQPVISTDIGGIDNFQLLETQATTATSALQVML